MSDLSESVKHKTSGAGSLSSAPPSRGPFCPVGAEVGGGKRGGNWGSGLGAGPRGVRTRAPHSGLLGKTGRCGGRERRGRRREGPGLTRDYSEAPTELDFLSRCLGISLQCSEPALTLRKYLTFSYFWALNLFSSYF